MRDALYTYGGLEFEWDEDKAASNLEKHGVSFFEAASVFLDDHGLYIPDLTHSLDEDRIILVGWSNRNVLTVSHAVRGERYRIITAREAEPWERRAYERARQR